MSILGVIFDLGHTLMHLEGTWPEVFGRGAADLAAFLDGRLAPPVGRAFAQALLERREVGYAVATETMREVTAEQSLRWTFAQLGMPGPDPSLVRDAADAFFAYEEACWKADPHAVPVLRALSAQGLRLGMFSNATDARLIQRLVDRLGFRPYLEPALSSAATGIRKPDPAALRPILDAWRLPGSSVVMVGDSLEADILGAQSAGLRSVWIRTRADARQEGTRRPGGGLSQEIWPDRSIGSLEELPACLKEMGL